MGPGIRRAGLVGLLILALVLLAALVSLYFAQRQGQPRVLF